MQIISIRNNKLKALVEAPELTSVKGFSPKEATRIGAMIVAINAMTHPQQLMTVPSWKAHELKPGEPGKWALKVTPNFRLTFHVDIEAQTVELLDYEDYH